MDSQRYNHKKLPISQPQVPKTSQKLFRSKQRFDIFTESVTKQVFYKDTQFNTSIELIIKPIDSKLSH